MGFANPEGRNWGPLVNWDGLGKLYASIIITWSAFLFTGITWLILRRKESFLRIRNIPLAVASTLFLHVYLVKIFLAYTTNGHFSCSAEFWIMSIYLPFGIALFQANMTQLQSISSQQIRLLNEPRWSLQSEKSKSEPKTRSRRFRWNEMTAVRKAEIVIGVGMLLQIVVTTAIYTTSPKLHGVWGNIPHAKGQAKCRKGWEWLPSAIWQLFWSWFFGPFVLYKIRNIQDVHNWRMQTIVCVISGLPGSPLWLASLYSKSFHSVNRYWVPPMWLAPGIMVMQAVTIFCPMYEGYRNQSQIRGTLKMLKAWDVTKQYEDSPRSSSSTRYLRPRTERTSSGSTATSHRSREMYTMAALEKALAMNPIPLFQFAATRDFTGENVVFLMRVREWRAAWSRADVYATPISDVTITDQARASLFKEACEIYAATIHSKTAEFPINLESKIYSDLEAVFGPAIAIKKREKDDNVVDPFNIPVHHGSPKTLHTDEQDNDIEKPKSIPLPVKEIPADMYPSAEALVKAPVIVSPGFDEHVFDAAEQSIMYLVLTNTWRKFVNGSRENLSTSP